MSIKVINGVEFVKCVHCGEWHEKADSIPVYGIDGVAKRNNRYIYEPHLENGSYFDKNNESFHKSTKNGFRCGFELECIPYSDEAKAAMLQSGYGFIATSDGSLPWGGVEFKTPVYENLNGVRQILITVASLANFTDPHCGQHVNASMTGWSYDDYDIIRDHANGLFDPLMEHMGKEAKATEKVCGRYFVHYAGDYGEYTRHENWLNLSHDNRIEWRLAKMQSAQQYFHLVNMVKEMLACIETNFLQHVGSKLEAQKVGVTANKLIRIFDKYAAGKAECQKPFRNTKTANKE